MHFVTLYINVDYVLSLYHCISSLSHYLFLIFADCILTMYCLYITVYYINSDCVLSLYHVHYLSYLLSNHIQPYLTNLFLVNDVVRTQVELNGYFLELVRDDNGGPITTRISQITLADPKGWLPSVVSYVSSYIPTSVAGVGAYLTANGAPPASTNDC